MSEQVMPEQQLHVNAQSLESLQRDQALALDQVQPGEAVVAHPNQLEKVSEAQDLFGERPSQELKGVINAAGENYNLVDTSVRGKQVRALTRTNGSRRGADLVGFVGEEGLTVRGYSNHEQERPLFKLSYDEHGNLRVDNLDNMPLSLATKSPEQTAPVAEQPTPSRFSPRSIFRGLVRAVRGGNKQPQEKSYTETLDWAPRYAHVEEAYAAERGESIVRTQILGREVQLAKSPEAERFWEQGHVKDASTFAEQTKELDVDPERFQGVVASAPSAVMSPAIRRTKVLFTEEEGVRNLDGFLSSVSEVAKRINDPDMAQQVEDYKEKFHFMTREEYGKACRGMAKMWFEYVKQGPDHVLNVFDNPHRGERSYTKVLADVMSEFKQLTEGLTFAGRVQTSPETWVTGYNSKLLVVDDWMVSGSTIKNSLAQAAEAARAAGKTNLLNSLEAHVLIARKGQTEDPTWEIGADVVRNGFKVRAYYETTQESGAHSVAPSGSHSSVDYGFETPLASMREYAMRHGSDLEMPLLTHVAREYRAYDRAVMTDPQQRETLEHTATLNAKIVSVEHRVAQLEREHARVLTPANHAGAGEAQAVYSQLVQARIARNALEDQRDALVGAFTTRNMELGIQ